MRVGNIIKKECEPILSKYGFKYLGSTMKYVWEFERMEINIKQKISFQKSLYSQKIEIIMDVEKEFSRSHIDFLYLITGIDEQTWTPYETEEDLKNLFHKAMAGFEEKGLEMLRILSIEALKPTEEMERKLIENPEKLAEEFRLEYGLEYAEYNNMVEKLENLIDEKREEVKIKNDMDFLIKAGAYLGELIIKNLGGYWNWYEEIKSAEVKEVAKTMTYTISESPLYLILPYYSNPEFFRYKLTTYCKNLEKDVRMMK
jgi:hypothetical protein